MDILKAIDILTEEIIKTSEYYFKKRTRYVRCSVVDVNKDGTYNVRYNNQVYKTAVLNSVALSKGDTVIMVIPDNKISNRFILGKI